MAATRTRKVGLIVPPLNGAVPPDAAAMYPDVAFEVEGLGVRALSEEGYEEAVGRVGGAARALAARGSEAVLLFGTSLSFFKGLAFNERLERVMRESAGVPSGTLTGAMAHALDALDVRHFAAATAYTKEVDDLFAGYFRAAGYSVDHIEGLGITAPAEVETVPPERIAGLARKVAQAAPEADAIVLSCAGLRTSGIAARLEAELGKPVLSSAMVGSWAAVRLAGHPGFVPGMGQLYEQSK